MINRGGLGKYQQTSPVGFPAHLTLQKGSSLEKSWPGMKEFKVLAVTVLHQAALGSKCSYAETSWRSLLSPKCYLPGIKFSGFKWVEKKESDELLGRVNSPWVNPSGDCGMGLSLNGR